MNARIKALFKDKIVRQSSIIIFLLLVVLTAASVFFYFRLPPYIPLYNQLPWGFDRLSDKIGIFIPVAIAYGFSFINILISAFIYEKMPLIARIVHTTSFLIILLTLIFVARTIQLVL